MRILVTWVGNSDLVAGEKNDPDNDPGPVLRLLRQESFDRVYLFHDYADDAAERYRQWLSGLTSAKVAKDCVRAAGQPLRNDYTLAYRKTRELLDQVRARQDAADTFAFLLSPGLPAMQVAMIVASQTEFTGPVELFNTFQPKDGGAGVERVELPYNWLQVEVLPGLLTRHRQALQGNLHPAFDEILGDSPAIRQAKEKAQTYALYAAPGKHCLHVLLRGESGTGKELFARAIHEASGRQGRFVPLNCGAIVGSLAESELFGHTKGAFTDAKQERKGAVELADGGTLFLDEIGDMPADLQVKLLRFLNDGKYRKVGSSEEGQSDVRVIAATHQDLERAIQEGRFRRDLHARVNGVTIQLPPLRHRRPDVRLLARHTLTEFCKEYELKRSFDEAAFVHLAAYRWPGNVRELESVVRQLAVDAGEVITGEDVVRHLDTVAGGNDRPLSDLSGVEYTSYLVACLDELVGRWNAPGRLPLEREDSDEGADLVERVLQPLLLGRAVKASGGTISKAGQLIRLSKGDVSREPGKRRWTSYREDWEEFIDEALVHRLRGTPS
jgi:DNA-binding NtrC family response regulator